jgi:hypothetical protein
LNREKLPEDDEAAMSKICNALQAYLAAIAAQSQDGANVVCNLLISVSESSTHDSTPIPFTPDFTSFNLSTLVSLHDANQTKEAKLAI